MSPAHSSHSLSPTQSLGAAPETDIRTHPFPTPPNSLPQHHHSPSNCATPHSGGQSLHGGDYSASHHGLNTSGGSSSSSGSGGSGASHSQLSPHDGSVGPTPCTSANPIMLRSALTVGMDRHLHQHMQPQRGSQQMTLLENNNSETPTSSGGPQEDRSADYDDIDVNLVPIVTEGFASELYDVSNRRSAVNPPSYNVMQLL